LQYSAFTGSEAAVAVPSRLYFKPTPWKPLNGRRIAIKDNIDLGGVVTGLGNRAYAELYGERSESAKLIQIFIEKGAFVVGKTKLSAFAGSEVPPTQCIDYFPPWNARGDGYQGPSGSSSGAASAAGGYSWLDHSIGTDSKHLIPRVLVLTAWFSFLSSLVPAHASDTSNPTRQPPGAYGFQPQVTVYGVSDPPGTASRSRGLFLPAGKSLGISED
jgi:hypothetical protein